MSSYLDAVEDMQEFLIRYEIGVTDHERISVIRDMQHQLAEMYNVEQETWRLEPYLEDLADES